MKKTIGSKTMEIADARDLKTFLKNDYSILKSVGADWLRLQMTIIGKLCQFLVWLVYLSVSRTTITRRHRAAKIVKFFFPTSVIEQSYQEQPENAASVYYFNHQSLFEVLAVIWYFLHYAQHYKQCLFSVNLPWYEALCPVIDKLAGVGIYITPLITPSTYRKLKKIDPDSLRQIDRIKPLFELEYGRLVVQFIENGDTIAVAPSATRTSYIFPSKDAFDGNDKEALKSMPKTMTAIVFPLRRANLEARPINFVPFVVTRNSRAGTGLNIWRHHNIYVGHANTLDEMFAELKHGTLDYNCYLRLANFIPDHIIYPH